MANSGTDGNRILLCCDFLLWMVKEFSVFNHCSLNGNRSQCRVSLQTQLLPWIAEQTYIIERLPAKFDSSHFLCIQLPLSFHCVHLVLDVPSFLFLPYAGLDSVGSDKRTAVERFILKVSSVSVQVCTVPVRICGFLRTHPYLTSAF